MNILLLGEPATGKSSFLVALYGGLLSAYVDGARLVRTVDEVEFLSNGLEALSSQQPVSRTDSEDQARLRLEVELCGRVVDIDIPDRSGEFVKSTLNERSWDASLLRQLDDPDGALLFIRSGTMSKGAGAETVGQLLAGTTAADDEPTADADDPIKWRPALMPTDARLVDLLQSIRERRSAPLRLAVIISAWDEVSDPKPSPKSWVAENLALLDQYLRSNGSFFPSATYGVSAQGGDFEEGLEKSISELDPWERVIVVGPEGSMETIVAPLEWIVASTL